MTYRLSAGSVDTRAPLIYMWEIHDGMGQLTGRYIGKANGGDKRPTRHYPRNVNRLLRKRPYRNGKHYRRVHVALANATEAGHEITLSYLCNVPSGQNIFEVETRYIREYGCDANDGIGLNGAAPVSRPAVQEDNADDEGLVDLEDFLEFVIGNYPGRFRIESTPLRYSLYIGDVRILRAKVSRGGNRVYIKCVRRKKYGYKPVEFVWDGTDKQLSEVIDRELQLYHEIYAGEQPL